MIFFIAFSFSEELVDDISKKKKIYIPNLNFKDLDNKKIIFKEFYKQSPILVNFWTLSCEPCKKEMLHLSKINEEYSDSVFKVISINMDTPRTIKKVKQFVNSQKYSFDVISDPRMELFRKIGGSVMPLVVLINMDGSIEKRHVGYNPGDEIKLAKEVSDLIVSNGLIINLKDSTELD
tara:strand:- start:8443 stop:8976 length:534 start_codon:yes stop_codon:yes gene_type:complete